MPLHKSTTLTNKTVSLITDFQSGKVKPITTGIPHLDKSCGRGLTPSLIVGITARSFSGKTFDLERIQSHIREHHPDVVQFHANWELNFFKILLRDISQKTGKTQSEILYNNPTAKDLLELAKVCDLHRNDNIYYENEPVTPEQFFEDVKELITLHPKERLIVTVDNLENILDTKNNQKSSIDAFLTQVNRLKDMHWFISFIILNQLNDNILQRIDNPKQHKPKESDIYSSGQFYKLCDVLYVKVLPWRLHITEKFMVFGKEAYPWLEDFKLFGNGNTASFEPSGIAYYFYLKRRGSDIKDMEDIFAERIFKSEQTNLPKKEQVSFIPNFGEKKLTPLADLITPPIENIFDMNVAFPREDDSPF
jgi:hypothetical protein